MKLLETPKWKLLIWPPGSELDSTPYLKINEVDIYISSVSSFGDWLLQKIKDSNLSRAQVAERIGISYRLLCKIIRGEKQPTLQEVLQLSNLLGWDYLQKVIKVVDK